jgi:phosphoenolpyruvate---glycerone phosphotransferase subunit DhaL
VGAITVEALARFLERYAATLSEQKAYLTDLDAAIGDADHGINMDRGFSAVVAKLPELSTGSAGALLKSVGMALISTVGGAAGPLYGTFFLRAAAALGNVTEIDPEHLGGALRAGLNGVMERGRARAGDKTMVDAMIPAVEAIEESAADGTWPAGLAHAAHAAASGRDTVTPLAARKGRASYLGSRSAGHQDPGATSATFLFEALRDALTEIGRAHV